MAAAAALALLAGCGSPDEPSEVPAAQREAIRAAFAAGSQPYSLAGTGCFTVTRPVSAATRRAHAVLLRVAREDPDAVLPSEDFPDLRPTIRQSVAGRARAIDTCISRYPEADRSWAELSRGLWAALTEMES